MSYDITITGAFNWRPGYHVAHYVRRDQTDVANNRSTYAWATYARGGPGQSFVLNPQPWAAGVGGNVGSGSRALDLRNVYEVLLGSGTTGWFNHDANGYLNLSIAAWIDNSGDGPFGFAETSGIFYTDRIAQTPAAPTPVGVDNIGTTTARYLFAGNSDGGSAIIEWQSEAALDLGFTSGKKTQVHPTSGQHTYTLLNPGAQYFFRSRGRNAAGWGAWSSVISASTLSGGFVGSGGSFQGAEFLVGKGTTFQSAEVFVGKDGAFVAAG